MEAGYTFLLAKVDDHLWVILSDPKQDADKILVVSVTTWRPGKDPACRIGRGEHSFVTHDSCMAYVEARVLSRNNLFTFKDTGLLTLQDPVTAGLLERMRNGAATSDHLKPVFKDLLRRQGLIS